MGVLDREIAVYAKMRDQLEADHFGEWAVVYHDEFVGTYEKFEDAVRVAVRRFGRGPYLIREVGVEPRVIHIPALGRPMQYAPTHTIGEDPAMTTSQTWMETTLERQQRLYTLYGKSLESEHTGKFAAISEDGDVLLGDVEGDLFQRALSEFGRDGFALVKVGHEVMDTWLHIS